MGNFLVKEEGFADKPKLKWKILSVSEGIEALEEAEARDEYQEMIGESTDNRIARKQIISWSPVEAPAEWARLLTEIEFPEWTNGLEIDIVALPSHVEGGMPHTRPVRLICIPENYSQSTETFKRMMTHEMVHILQRMYYDQFMKFIGSQWKYYPPTRREYEKIPYKLLKRRRINPDTLMCPVLIWNDRWAPIIIFNDHLGGTKLTSTRLIWWDLWTERAVEDAPTEWTELFGTDVGQTEHPFEMAAWYLSDDIDAPAATMIRAQIASILTRK